MNFKKSNGIIDFFSNMHQQEQKESSLLNSKSLLTPGDPYDGIYRFFRIVFKGDTHTHIPTMMIIFTLHPQLAYLDSMHAPLRNAISVRSHFYSTMIISTITQLRSTWKRYNLYTLDVFCVAVYVV